MATTFAQGTLLQRRTTTGTPPTPDVYTTVASVHSLSGPSLTGDVVDVSNQDTANGFRAFISGLRTGGTMSFDISYAPADNTHDASSTGLIGDLKDGSEERWRLLLNTPTLENTITGATGSPEVLTIGTNTFTDGQSILISSATGSWGTEMNGRTFVVSERDATSIELSSFNPSATWSANGGTVSLQTFFQFQGFVSGFEVTAPVDGALAASVTITATGSVTSPVFA